MSQITSMYERWFKPRLTPFDRVTEIRTAISQLECDLRDREEECHQELHDIEAARRELQVRVKNG